MKKSEIYMDVQTIYLSTYFCTHFILKTSVQKVVHKQYLNILSRKNLIFQSNYLISFEICIFPHFLKKSYNSIPKLFDLTKNENPLSYHFPLSYSKPNWDRLALRTIGNLSLVDTEQKKLSNYSAWMQIQTCIIFFQNVAT